MTRISCRSIRKWASGMRHTAMERGLLRTRPALRVVLVQCRPLGRLPRFAPDPGTRPKLQHCSQHARRWHPTCERPACARRRRAIAPRGFRGISSMYSTTAKQLALERHVVDDRRRVEVGAVLCTKRGRRGGSAGQRVRQEPGFETQGDEGAAHCVSDSGHRRRNGCGGKLNGG